MRSSASKDTSPPTAAVPRRESFASLPIARASAGIGEREAAHRALALEGDARRLLGRAGRSGRRGSSRRYGRASPARHGCRPRRTRLRSIGLEAGPTIEALRSSLPIWVAPGMAPAWILRPTVSSADLPPSMSRRALAETMCRPGVAIVESSSKKRSPLSVVSPGERPGEMIAGVMPSRRELRSSVSFRPAPCRATTTSPRAQTSAPAAKSSLASKLSSAPCAVEGELHRRQVRAGWRDGRRCRPPARRN